MSPRPVGPSHNLAFLHPDVAAEWHPTRNGELRPQDLAPASNRIVWWRCVEGHEWQTRVATRTRAGQRCPACRKGTIPARLTHPRGSTAVTVALTCLSFYGDRPVEPMERLWVRWPVDDDVAAAYEVRVGPFGVETVLYTSGVMAEERILTGFQEALANMLAGLAPSGEAPRRARNLDQPVACVHAQMASTGRVTIGWGDGPSEDHPGGRATAFVLVAHGQHDLERRRGRSPGS